MASQVFLSKILQDYFIAARAKNPLFSQRALARRLSLSPGSLSEILKGRRKISLKLAEQIADRLLLDPQTRSEVLKSVAYSKGLDASRTSETSEYAQLNGDQFALISEWYHYGILSLLNTRDFKNDVPWISRRLGLSQRQTTEALGRLKRLGMIEENAAGRLRRARSKYKTSDGIMNIAIRRHHLEDLDLIRNSLEQESLEDRDYSSVTMAVAKNKLGKAKELVRRFQDDIADLLEVGPCDEVYRLSVALHPLTKPRQR